MATHFNIFHETVSSILKEFDIPIRKGKNLIILKKDEKEWKFSTYKEAGQFLIETGVATCGIDNLRKNIIPKKDFYNGYEIIRG